MLRALVAARGVPGLLRQSFRGENYQGKLFNLSKGISTSSTAHHERLHEVLPPLESFSRRHIGPSPEEVSEMLEVCGVKVCCVLRHYSKRW